MPDGNWQSRSLLCHFDGANAATAFTDQKGHTLTAIGGAKLTTADKVFGTASLELNGSTDGAWTADAGGEFALTGDFMIEFRFKLTAAVPVNSRQVLVAYGHDAGEQNYWEVAITKGPVVQAPILLEFVSVVGGAKTTIYGQNGPGDYCSVNTWVACCVQRSGTTVKIGNGGSQYGSGTVSSLMAVAGKRLDIGCNSKAGGTAQDFASARIDELRISDGVAEYTFPYTVATAAFADTGPAQSGFAALPIILTVARGGHAALPIELAVMPAALANGSRSPTQSFAGAAGAWALRVLLDGADVSNRVIGRVTVEAEEGAARLADFALRPAAGVALDLGAWAGLPVSIDLCALVGGAAVWPQRLFTGVIDSADLDLSSRLLAIRATDGLETVIAALDNAALATLIGGRWSDAVFDPAATGLAYARDRLSTVPACLDLDPYRQPRLTAWQAKGAADFTHGAGQAGDGSIALSPAERSSLVNRVDIAFNYRFPRIKAESHAVAYSYVNMTNFAAFVQADGWFLTREAVVQAINAAGGTPLGAISYDALPTTNVPVGSGFWTPNPAVDAQLCMGFTADVTFDYGQSQEEAHAITVQNAASIAAHGLRPESLSGALEGKAPDPDTAEIAAFLYKADIKKDIPPDVATPQAGMVVEKTLTLTAGTDRAAANAAMACLIDVAKTRIAAAHRQSRVAWQVVANAHLDVDKTLALNAGGVQARGKVRKVVHVLDPDSGSAVSTVEVALSSLLGVGASHPDTPTAAPAGTSDATSAISSSPLVVYNYGSSQDHQITITFPAVTSTARDNKVTPLASAYDAPILEDLFTVTP